MQVAQSWKHGNLQLRFICCTLWVASINFLTRKWNSSYKLYILATEDFYCVLLFFLSMIVFFLFQTVKDPNQMKRLLRQTNQYSWPDIEVSVFKKSIPDEGYRHGSYLWAVKNISNIYPWSEYFSPESLSLHFLIIKSWSGKEERESPTWIFFLLSISIALYFLVYFHLALRYLIAPEKSST